MPRIEITQELLDKIRALGHAYHNELGHEILDPEPIAKSMTRKALSLKEQIQRVVRRELSIAAAGANMETFEEFNDLTMPDEEEFPVSAHEMIEEIPVSEKQKPLVVDEADSVSVSQPVEPEGKESSDSEK